jgi:hypothetical protein
VKPTNSYHRFAEFSSELLLLDTFSIGKSDFIPNDFSVSDGAVHAVGSIVQHSQEFRYQQKFLAGSMSAFNHQTA